MSTSLKIQQAVQATPGLNTRAVAASIGITDDKGIACVSALLHQCFLRGKIRREKVAGQLLHHPTALICVDKRKGRRKPGGRSDQRKAQRERAARQAAVRAAAKAAPKARAPKATAEQAAKLAERFIKPAGLKPSSHAGKVETVDEFLRRGGHVQKVGPFDTSTPLRYDHSHGTALNKPVRRTRVAVAP